LRWNTVCPFPLASRWFCNLRQERYNRADSALKYGIPAEGEEHFSLETTKFIPKARLVDRDRFLLDYARGKSVLHIGMGGCVDDDAATGEFIAGDLAKSFHGRLSSVARSIIGIDINPKTIEAMRQAVPGNYAVCDVTSSNFVSEFGDRKFQVVVFGDVIEHLDNCKTALQNLRSVMTEDGILMVSTVNAYSFDAVLKMMVHYESVHPEHTAYFSYSTLRRLFEMNSLEIIDFKYYTHKRIEKFGSLTFWLSYRFSSLFVSVFPQYAMGVVAIARPVTEAR
jgi:2-polyprenyl-3-methyl-5-hydroxy-6-metoxy-1,4-benzoquinol methylase